MPRKRRQRRGGRPSKYSPGVGARICRAVAEGCSRDVAAALAGINAATLYDWQHRFPEFSESLQKADSEFESECIFNVRRAGTSKRNWTASAWLLERKHPERWARTDRHLIRNEGVSVPLPEEYVEAICRALGLTGKLVPLRADGELALLPPGLPASNGDPEFDINEVLPP